MPVSATRAPGLSSSAPGLTSSSPSSSIGGSGQNIVRGSSRVNRLDHMISGVPGSFWHPSFRPSQVLGEDAFCPADRHAMQAVGPLMSLSSTETCLLRALSIVRHEGHEHGETYRRLVATQAELQKSKAELAQVNRLKMALVRTHGKYLSSTSAFAAAMKANIDLSHSLDVVCHQNKVLKQTGDEVFNKMKGRIAEVEAYHEGHCDDIWRLTCQLGAQMDHTELVESRLTSEVEVLKAKLAAAQKAASVAEEAREKAEERQKEAEDAVRALQDKNAMLEADIEEATKEIVAEHQRGFGKAIRQASVLYPGLDASAFDIMKDVKDGTLVDEVELSDEE